MKKFNKILLISVAVLAIFSLATLVLAGLYLDQLVKKGIETVAPPITQTSVKVDSVSLSALAGSVGIKGLVVGNPAGYQTPAAIRLGQATVRVEPKSLLADKVIVRAIEIRAPEITFEGNPIGENNLKKIMANVNASAGTKNTAHPNPPGPASAAPPGKKLQVDALWITGAKVHARLTGLTSQDFTVTLPDIQFSSLGQGPDGLTAAELLQKVWQRISADTIKAVGDESQKLLNRTANEILKRASANAEKAVGDGAEKIKKGLGGLLGK